MLHGILRFAKPPDPVLVLADERLKRVAIEDRGIAIRQEYLALLN